VVVSLPRALADEMIAHSRSELPNEACGLLAQRDGRLHAFYPARNADASPFRYTVAPDDLRRAIEIEDAGDDVAIYHSHTKSRAYPSRTDVELAQITWPDATYLIVSLAGTPADIAAWSLAGGRVEAIELVIEG
jgi:proteasome lid subunit RPN8/RPN11